MRSCVEIHEMDNAHEKAPAQQVTKKAELCVLKKGKTKKKKPNPTKSKTTHAQFFAQQCLIDLLNNPFAVSCLFLFGSVISFLLKTYCFEIWCAWIFCLNICLCSTCLQGAEEGIGSGEQEFHVVVSCLDGFGNGTISGASGREESPHNCWAWSAAWCTIS